MYTQTGLGVVTIDVAANHSAATYFAKFAAVTITASQDGWVDGMHRLDMKFEYERIE